MGIEPRPKTGNRTRLLEPGALPGTTWRGWENCLIAIVAQWNTFWVGSHNPLSFLNCRTPSTGTIRPTVCVRTTISNLEGVQMVCLVARTVSGGNRMSPEPNRWDKALRADPESC